MLENFELFLLWGQGRYIGLLCVFLGVHEILYGALVLALVYACSTYVYTIFKMYLSYYVQGIQSCTLVYNSCLYADASAAACFKGPGTIFEKDHIIYLLNP